MFLCALCVCIQPPEHPGLCSWWRLHKIFEGPGFLFPVLTLEFPRVWNLRTRNLIRVICLYIGSEWEWAQLDWKEWSRRSGRVPGGIQWEGDLNGGVRQPVADIATQIAHVLTGQQQPRLDKEGLLQEGHEAWCEEISHLSPEQLVLGGAARTMHQWLRDAGVKGGDAKGDKMVQAGREVLFKIKNAYFQEALQSQPEQTVRTGKASRGFLPNQWTKVGQDKSVPVRALPASRQVATKGGAKKAQSKKYSGTSVNSAQMPTMNQALHLPPKSSSQRRQV